MKRVIVTTIGEYSNIPDMLRIAKDKYSWEIFIQGPKTFYKHYHGFLDSDENIFEMPDISYFENRYDSHEIKKIELIISEIEKKTLIPISRILLAAERSLGRAYSKEKYYWPDAKISKKILKNNSYPMHLLTGIFIYYNNLINRIRPDFILGLNGGGLKSSPIYFLSKYYNIPTLSPSWSNVISNHYYWSSSYAAYNDSGHNSMTQNELSTVNPSVESVEYVRSFSKDPKLFLITENKRIQSIRRLFLISTHLDFFKQCCCYLRDLVKKNVVLNKKPFFRIYISLYKFTYLYYKQKKLYGDYSENELKKIKYIYYPCNMEPEFVLNTRATDYYDQISTIKKISYNLPHGYKLLVREHFGNVVRRPSSWLKEVLSYPGVVLIGPFSNQFKYIKNSNLVITVNGSTGFESILLGKRTIALDKTNYDPLLDASCYRDKIPLSEAIIRALTSEKNVNRKAIASFVDLEKKICFKNSGSSSQFEVDFVLKLLKNLRANRPEEI
jgi:hypothetical protein